jgi:import inner membrane translocase subunit TIM16
MAAGPLARLLAQLVVPVVAVLARALPAAYAQALQNARKAGVTHKEATQSLLRKTISRTEALQVLNLTERDAADPEIVRRVSAARRAAAAAAAVDRKPPRPHGSSSIASRRLLFSPAVFPCRPLCFSSVSPERPEQQFERYMASNDPKKGGSFYLQSKVYRAKEMLDEFEADKRREQQQEQEEEEEARRQQSEQQEGGGGGGSPPRP